MKRKVYISEGSDTWFVCYSARKFGGRYNAAAFHKSMRTREQVVQWINDNPKLELDDKLETPL